MPIWVTFYIAIYGLFTWKCLRNEIRNGESIFIVAAEIAAESGLVLAALAYWIPALKVAFEKIIPFVFVGSLAWVLVVACYELKDELTEKDKVFRSRIVFAAAALGFSVLLMGPLVYWGYMCAVEGMTEESQ